MLHALGYRKRHLTRRLVLEVAAVAGSGWGAGLALSLLLSAWLNNSFYAPKGWALNPSSLASLLFTIPIPLAAVAFTGLGINRTLNRLDAVAIIERGKLSTEAGQRQPVIKRCSPRPLSFFTFYERHRRRGLMLFFAIVLMVLGVAFPAFFIATYNDGNVPLTFSYLRHASIVSPAQVYGAVDPEAVAQIQGPSSYRMRRPGQTTEPDGERISSNIRRDRHAHLRRARGRFADSDGRVRDASRRRQVTPPRSNEIVLSSAVALNRGVRVGDKVGQPVYERDGMLTEMVVVGILEPDRSQSRSEQASGPFSYAPQWLGFAPYDYVEGHERYAAVPTHFLVAPVAGREAELEAWLEENVDSPQVAVETFNKNYQFVRGVERDMFLFFAVAEAIVAVAAAVALAALHYIFFVQRQEEFGVLHAIGYSRTWLVLRTLRESVSVVSVAWVIGAALCATSLLYAQANVYAPKGMRINLYNPWPWLFTLPIPLAVVAASAATIAWALSRLDPVSIVERR